MAGHKGPSGLLLLGIGSLLLGASPSLAGDWTVKAGLSESIIATDNVNFDVDDPVGAVGSITAIDLDILARSHVFDFNLSGSLGYQFYFNDGSEIPDAQYLPSLNASYTRRARDLTFIVGAAYVFTPGEDQRGITLLDDGSGGIPDDDGGGDGVQINTGDGNADRHSLSANSSVAYKLNATNELRWLTRAARIDFSGENSDEEDPNTNLGTSLTWNHNRTRRVDLNVSGGVDWYKYDNDENQIDYVYFVTGGFAGSVTRRLSVNGNLGVNLLDSYKDVTVGMAPDTTTRSEHKTDLGGRGGLGFSYAFKTGSIAGGINYGLTPDDDGELANSLSATLAFRHEINDRSSLGVSAGYRLADSEVDGVLSNTSFSVSPYYSYLLTRDWQLGLNYTFNMQDEDDGRTTENRVTLSLSRSYVILP